MIYREVGKTTQKGSIIGLGCEHLDGKPYEQVKETIDAALEYGINIMDVFMPGKEVRDNIARALGTNREKVLIQGHIGSTDINQQYDISRDLPTVQKYFEDLLKTFGYIDFGMMFFIDSEDDYKGVFDTGFITYVEKLKKQGDIRHIGFSSHNPETAAKVIRTGVPETMMFSINLGFDLYPADQYIFSALENGFDTGLFRGIDPKRAELYKLCEQKGVGITVMKTLGAGKLISKEHSPFGKPMTVAQCLHYVLTRPAVASAMLGCKSRSEILEAAAYLDMSDEERDYTPILDSVQNDFKGSCVYCSHCQPCPSAIDIAAVNKYLDIARLDEGNIPPSIKSHYNALSAHGRDCIGCGSCEKRCPFGVPIMENMKKASLLFE